jgi:DNA-directed RNA polymerase subunit M/transcription elongation factor TFIIS
MKNQVVFQCKKCEHLLFVEKIDKEKLQEIMNLDCPNCGEESYGNWILLKMGNYEEEYGY